MIICSKWRRSGWENPCRCFDNLELSGKQTGTWLKLQRKQTNNLRFAVFIHSIVSFITAIFFHRSLGLCCCRFSSSFEAVLRNKIYGSDESKGNNVSVVPKRTLIGSFIPNPLGASRRKKYSERGILGWVWTLLSSLYVQFDIKCLA